MEKSELIYLRVTSMLGYLIYDNVDCCDIADAIIDDVVEDIEETADEEFNDADVRIAIVRVLRKRLNI